MSVALTAVMVAVLAWWIATGAVIVAARASLGHPLYVLMPSVALAVAGLATLFFIADMVTVAAVYGAFFSALAIWALHEVTFLLGYVTGPRKATCSPDSVGWPRFREAFAAIRDHELALFLTSLLLVVLFFGAANPFGWAIYALMWFMRLLTKFNVFLGAPNAVSDILPERMAYLTSYFRTDRTHPFFIMSVMVITGLFTACCYMAATVGEPALVAGWSLMATFAFLGLIEHLFLVLPVRDAALWSWAVGAGHGPGFLKKRGSEDQRRITTKKEQACDEAAKTAPAAS